MPVRRVWMALAAVLAACSGESETPSGAAATRSPLALPGQAETLPAPELPPAVEVLGPTQPIVNLESVEDSSEAVANSMVELADKLRRRDFGAALQWFPEDFAGHALDPLPTAKEESLPLGSTKRSADVKSPPIVDGSGFLAALRVLISPWTRMEGVTFKVKAAEFQTGLPAWGKVRQQWTFLGQGPEGGPRSLVVWAQTRVENRAGRWVLTRLALESVDTAERARALFTEVATSAGVAHAGIRFGRPGNQSFAWNGAGAGDVDGDGLYDLFVPSRPQNFLYLARPAGGFVDEAEARGLSEPAGGTGVVFLDFDNDHDQDLFVADVGWRDGDAAGGNPLRLYVNDGTGHFAERGGELGFGDYTDAYSLCAFDAEGDGFLDVFVCCYGRVEREPNNSWIQATNGSPDRFYHNLGGQGFREEAAQRGLVDQAWSYAAAAADFDLDGDQDLYVASDYGVNLLWVNDGRGHFVDRAAELGAGDLGNGMGAAWGDLDNDGRVDLYVSNMSSTAGKRILERLGQKDEHWKDLSKLAAGNSIFLARAGSFERLDPKAGGISGSWAWAPTLLDLDLDGRLDLYCCSGYVTGDTPADT